MTRFKNFILDFLKRNFSKDKKRKKGEDWAKEMFSDLGKLKGKLIVMKMG